MRVEDVNEPTESPEWVASHLAHRARGARWRPGPRLLLLTSVALWTGACRSDTIAPVPPPPPAQKSEAELTFLRQAQTAPALLTTDTSFLATRGQGMEVELFYAPAPGESSGEEFLEFELDDESLHRYPATHPRAGRLFQDGDTITIRITVDASSLIVTMEPSGLEFSTDEPAELEIRYGHADEDYDDDGAADPPETEQHIDLWRQERLGEAWFRVGEIKDRALDRVRARLTSFSRYALAI